MNQPLVALDVGSTKVACAIGLPHEESAGFELLGTSIVPYPVRSEAWLADPLMVGQAIEQALDAAAVHADVPRALVAVTHPGVRGERIHASISLSDEPIAVRAQDLERLQRNAVDQALSIDRDALIVERLGTSGNGFEGVRDPRGLSATRLRGTFYLISMPVAARQALVQALEVAGMDLAQLSYALPATLAAAGDEDLTHQHVLVVDMGGLTTDLGFFIDGILHRLEIVPLGGLWLAAEIAQHLHATIDQATTWSREGVSCRVPQVRAVVEQQWAQLEPSLTRLLEDQPRPDAVLLTGRAALIDGFAEWLERVTHLTTTICRSPHTQRIVDLAQQVALNNAVGLLELSTRVVRPSGPAPAQFLNRLLHRTRTVLTEYF